MTKWQIYVNDPSINSYTEVRMNDGTSTDAKGYKAISISIYDDDLAKLDYLVAQLKGRGAKNACRSRLIRFALNQVDVNSAFKAFIRDR